MSVLRALRPALGALAAGLLLAALSHPAVASAFVAALGEAPRRALDPGYLGALALRHLGLAALGLGLVGIAGIGLGILATRPGAAHLRGGIDALAAAAQAVPPVVVVALALPVLGFGGPPTLLALVFYGLMPTLRGTVGALEGVSAEVREAAKAMGLTPAQTFASVELPLAAPAIVETLRTALVLAIATTAVGALAGAGFSSLPIEAG